MSETDASDDVELVVEEPASVTEPPGPRERFEFDDEGRELLASVAQWIGIAALTGWASVGLGAFAAVRRALSTTDSLGMGVLFIWVAFGATNALISWWFLKIRRDLLEALIPGNDAHRALMNGLDKVSSYYGVHKVALQILGGLMVLLFVALLAALLFKC